MAKSQSRALAISEIFQARCRQKKYQVEVQEIANALRVVVSNFKSRSNVDVFHTGTIVIGGSQSELKDEMQGIKKQFEENPEAFLTLAPPARPCAAKYDILSPDMRSRLRDALSGMAASASVENSPDNKIDYRLKIEQAAMKLTITQFKNGTLWLQGKTDDLFDRCCNEVEEMASPAGKDVIARFIAAEEQALNQFMKIYTPQLLLDAEAAVREKLGAVERFLSEHDRKWLVASEALCQSGIPMPEYSAYVMPASKAFEGFCKKLLTAIGLFDAEHFKAKNASFFGLSEKKDPKRKSVCDKERYAESFLERIKVQLEFCRNFMMHSDDSPATKINSVDEAKQKVDKIFEEIKEIFSYFSKSYSL